MPKIINVFFLFLSCIGFSQTSKTIYGKVFFEDRYQKNIEIINYTQKKISQTNDLGEFVIEAMPNDVLVIMSEKFADQKYTLTADDFEKKIVSIQLIEKPIPLEEVEINRVKAIKIASVSYNDMKMAKIQKDAARPRNRDVYTGEIENGVDFMQIGRMIGKLFKSKNPKPKPEENVSFNEYAKTNFKSTFFTETLKLKPDDINRFLAYCETDITSKSVMKTDDELAILEFLLAKKQEFDQLK